MRHTGVKQRHTGRHTGMKQRHNASEKRHTGVKQRHTDGQRIVSTTVSSASISQRCATPGAQSA